MFVKNWVKLLKMAGSFVGSCSGFSKILMLGIFDKSFDCWMSFPTIFNDIVYSNPIKISFSECYCVETHG